MDREDPNDAEEIDDEGGGEGRKVVPVLEERGGGGSSSGGSCLEGNRKEIPGLLQDGIGAAGGRKDGGRVTRGAGGGRVWLGQAGVLAGVGTLCKEQALTALVVCVAWDVILHRKHVRG